MDWPLSTLRLLDQNFGLCITPDDNMLPYFSNTAQNYFRPWKLCSESAKENESTIENTKDGFKLNLDVQHFKPEEITVKINNREVIIEGRHEDRQDGHGFISRQFVRRYGLPKDCATESVTSSLSSDGVLSITANKIANAIRSNEKIVPITMCGPCKKEECKDMSKSKSEAKSSCTKEALKEQSTSSKMESNEAASASLSESVSACANMSSRQAASMSESVSACSKMEMKDTACSMTTETEKKGQGLLEDHCRPMKPELLKEAASGTEKILSESRKETDELLKLMSLDKMGGNLSVTTERVEEALQQCKTAMSELAEKVAESSLSSSEMSSFKSSMISESSTVSESFESKESVSISGKSSSMLSESLMKQGADKLKLSELVSEVISAELREAAENI